MLSTMANKEKFGVAKRKLGDKFLIITEKEITILDDAHIVELYENGDLVFIDRYKQKFIERFYNGKGECR